MKHAIKLMDNCQHGAYSVVSKEENGRHRKIGYACLECGKFFTKIEIEGIARKEEV